MGLIVQAEIIYLHPEVYLLVALKTDWLAVRRSDSRTNLGRSNYKIPGSDIFRSHGLHLVGDDQRRGIEPIIGKIRHHKALTPGAFAVPIHILNYDIEPIAPRSKRKSLPIHRRVLRCLGQ